MLLGEESQVGLISLLSVCSDVAILFAIPSGPGLDDRGREVASALVDSVLSGQVVLRSWR